MTLPAGTSRAEAFLELTREEVAALPWPALCRRAGSERPDAFVPAVRISVVIPTFNRVADLKRTLAALESERSALPFGVEIVVVDDGSLDGTGPYLAEWTGRTPGTKVLSQANAGPARARNRGAAAATGELVLFLGDDTIPEPGFLSVHERAHRLGGPGPLAVLGYTTWDEERMRVTPFLTHLNENGTQFGYSIIPDPDDVPFNFFYTSNVSVPRGSFLVLGGFDEEFPYAAWEDVEFAYRASRATPALRMVYRPSARTRHYHPTTLPSFRRRQRKAGEAAATFARKHPELSHWLGLEEAANVRSGRRPLRLALEELAIRILDPFGVPLPSSAYDRLLRWDYLQGVRGSVAPGARPVPP
jgi:glycosyltransferase involved in cell wall biosynthesis